jgi:2-polyprenyl-3-methyl-5-hydroxy-6-metoxy-1,4-benzoquinol methylase
MSLTLNIKCPSCQSADLDFCGPIPKTDVFAGIFLQTPLEPGSLYRCVNCSLGFRWPQLTKSELNDLYQKGDDQTWSVSNGLSRLDWALAVNLIREKLGHQARVLDVGCFDGGFLDLLGFSYDRFGVEIHKPAAIRAQEKGVKIIASDYAGIAGEYDCITSFDVIEHVENPKEFIISCMKAVVPGGYVLISTGNMDSFAFKMQGSKYWYSTISEHISFISPKWVDKLAFDQGYQVETINFFSHAEAKNFKFAVKELILNVLYWMHPKILGWIRQLTDRQGRFLKHQDLMNHPPSWFTAKDHFMVMLKKS